jgi:hypothetical protein
VEWMHLTQDRDSWRAVENTEMDFPVPLKAENFLIS